MAVTIYDVAKLAEVSTATVSRIVNNTGNVSPKTKAKVKAAMKQLNFSPNSLAQSFAKMKSKTIGFLMPVSNDNKLSSNYIDTIYFSELFRGINHVLLSEEYSILLINTRKNFERIIQEFIEQKRIEGLIIGLNPSYLEGFKESILQKKSIVYIGQLEKFNLGLHVYAQYIQYIKKMFDYFVKNGHKNISFFGLQENISIIRKSLQNEKDIIINYYRLPDSIQGMQEQFKALFSTKDRPTAIFFETFDRIQPLLSILYELNLKVPQDVSLISVEHKEGLGVSYIPQITNVYVPAFEMGKVAAKVLLDYLKGNINEYNQQFNLESKIIERGSVRKID